MFGFGLENKENPLDLDWGEITVDGLKDTTAVHVFNSDLNKTFCERRTKSLIVNKYRYYKKHLPHDKIQEFTLDIRGQNISIEKQHLIKNEILKEIHLFDDKPKISIRFFA